MVHQHREREAPDGRVAAYHLDGWQVFPDGVANPVSKAGESSGRRTITPPDVGLAPERLSPEQQRAWAYIAQHGIEVGWPRPGRPRKADREAGRPRLVDLGLTKQQIHRCRAMAGACPGDAALEARMDELERQGRRISHEGIIGRHRPRRKAERLIDDVRRSVPYFTPEEVQRLLDVLADLLETSEEPER